MHLDSQILEIIRSTLPESTAGVLKTYLEQAEKNSKLIAELNTKVESLRTAVDSRDREITKLGSQISENGDLEKKRKELAILEEKLALERRDLELTILKATHEEVKRSRQEIHELVDRVFRNPIITHERYYQDSKSGYDNQRGSYSDSISTTDRVTITKE